MTATRTLPPVVRRGEASDGPFSLVITPENAGWGYSSLRILELPAGGATRFGTGEDEMCVLPLAGGCVVECDGQRLEITGRAGVFTRVTDFAYVPRDAEVTVSSVAGGRFALPAARATRRLTARYGPAEGVQVELRGAGQASRQVNNFCTPATFDADRMIAVEVLTPAANWSSFPPHKHDEQRPDERGPARGGLLLRGRPGRARLPARLHLRPGPGDRRLRRGAHRGHRAGPARLARPVDGHPRLPPLLPERDGRPQPGPDLADLRRPGARLGAGHLGGAGDRPAAAADERPRRSTT